VASERILIVEDDPAVDAFVETALEREGFSNVFHHDQLGGRRSGPDSALRSNP